MTDKPAGRRYDDACGIAHALELIGDRWALLVVRELMFGPRRFGELRQGLPGLSANVLTQRLEGLEAAGILGRRRLPPPASVQVYELTPWGYESEAAMRALGRWAMRSPAHDPSRPLSGASLMLSFRTLLDAERARGLDVRIGFRIGPDAYMAHIAHGAVAVTRGEFANADLVIAGDATAIAIYVHGGRPPAALQEEGALTVEGPRWLTQMFATLFPLPAKAG